LRVGSGADHIDGRTFRMAIGIRLRAPADGYSYIANGGELMPWNAAAASSQAAQQRMTAQANQAHQRMHQHARALQAQQMRDLMSHPHTTPVTAGQPAAAVGRRVSPLPKALFLFLLAGVVATLIVVLVASLTSRDSSYGIAGTGGSPSWSGEGIGAAVNSPANVRVAARKSSRRVGGLKPGSRVTVLCRKNGWARLSDPYAGRYVWADLLFLAQTPPPCAP
jgi:Bacterial SH3 domain